MNIIAEPTTAQSIIDTVYTGLKAQGRRSVDDTDSCMYRGPGGLKCAAGQLIADEEYRPSWEGLRIGSIDCLPSRLRPHVDLIDKLQRSHDCWDGSQDDLDLRIGGIAEKHGLHNPAVPRDAS